MKEIYTALKKKGLQSTTQAPTPVTRKVREKQKQQTKTEHKASIGRIRKEW